jgi:hypothetical protein
MACNIMTVTWSVIVAVWTAISPSMETIAGFESGYLLFVLQERHKEKIATKAARQSVFEELRSLELLLSIAVMKGAHNSSKIVSGMIDNEVKWLATVGIERSSVQPFTPEQVKNIQQIASQPRDFIIAFLATQKIENQPLELPTGLTNSTITGPTAGKLSPNEVRCLLEVTWQIHILNTEARRMCELFRMSFTVTDEENNMIVNDNHAHTMSMYGY